MSLRFYLLVMSIGTFLCWVAWGYVLFTISPADAGALGLTFFYLSLFMAVVGSVSVGGFLVRQHIIKNDEIVLRYVGHTFRQSALVALGVVTILYLAAHHLLSWWTFTLVVAFVIILEAIIFTKRKFNNVEYV